RIHRTFSYFYSTCCISYVVLAGLKRKIAVPFDDNAVQSLLSKKNTLSSKKYFPFNAHDPPRGSNAVIKPRTRLLVNSTRRNPLFFSLNGDKHGVTVALKLP